MLDSEEHNYSLKIPITKFRIKRDTRNTTRSEDRDDDNELDASW